MLLFCMFVFCFQQNSLHAQNKNAEKKEEISISPAIQFSGVQKSDNSVDLKVSLKTKVKGAFIQLPFLKVNFTLMADTVAHALGTAITDANGKIVFNVKEKDLITDKEGKLHFKATLAQRKEVESSEEELTIKRARIVIDPVKDDSTLNVHGKMEDLSTGTPVPVPETTIGVYVKRLFYPMKIGEGTTDEKGEFTVEIPKNLPADAKGNIILIAKIDENENFGNLEASLVQKWGIPVSDKIEAQPRTLWSSHPPLWMLITFFLLMSIVWGHYIVIVVQLIKLRKEEPHPDTLAKI